MKDLMIDIETLDTARTAVILSIGAVEFDMWEGTLGDHYYNIIDLRDSISKGRTISAETLFWWLEQDQAVREDTFGLLSRTESMDIVLNRLTRFVKASKPKRVWANAPTFDLEIIRNAYGPHIVPWHYRQERCCRTLWDSARELGFVSAKIATTNKHNALADADNQARGIIAAWQYLTKINK